MITSNPTPCGRPAVVLLCLLVLSFAPALAQAPKIAPVFMTSANLDALEQKLRADLVVTADKTAAVNAVIMPELTRHRTLMGHRDANAPGEIHDDLSDFGILRSGSGLLRYGGTLVNRTMPTPGEPRGTALEGFKTLRVNTGDMLYIPAGVAHQFVPDPGKPLTFMLFKPSSLKPADRPAELMSWTADRLDAMTKELAGRLDEMKGANIALVTAGTTPVDRRVLMGYREGPGVGESHQRFAEFVFIRSGSGTVTLGGTIAAAKTGEFGETVGTSVTGGTRRAFAAGDLMYIPEGLAHQFAPDQGKSFNAVLFRFPVG